MKLTSVFVVSAISLFTLAGSISAQPEGGKAPPPRGGDQKAPGDHQGKQRPPAGDRPERGDKPHAKGKDQGGPGGGHKMHGHGHPRLRQMLKHMSPEQRQHLMERLHQMMQQHGGGKRGQGGPGGPGAQFRGQMMPPGGMAPGQGGQFRRFGGPGMGGPQGGLDQFRGRMMPPQGQDQQGQFRRFGGPGQGGPQGGPGQFGPGMGGPQGGPGMDDGGMRPRRPRPQQQPE